LFHNKILEVSLDSKMKTNKQQDVASI